MTRFVLVHGAWHGAWCWTALARALVARGHVAETPHLPCDEPSLSVEACAALVDAGTRVYLGGLLPTGLPASAAFHPRFGGFLRDELGRSYWPDEGTCAERLYPDCTRAQSDAAFSQLRRQSPLEPVPASLGRNDVVLATMRDVAIDPAWQVATARAAGARLVEIDSGHSPFITQPDELADVLDELA
jgi:pimeloyl-ACP methyl ester carboxylesterase